MPDMRMKCCTGCSRYGVKKSSYMGNYFVQRKGSLSSVAQNLSTWTSRKFQCKHY
jgi:hypothetical protein